MTREQVVENALLLVGHVPPLPGAEEWLREFMAKELPDRLVFSRREAYVMAGMLRRRLDLPER